MYLIFQRYKFKSKSQHDTTSSGGIVGVFDISKIQIQKQITTVDKESFLLALVYLIFQRYKFKSKSQRATANALTLLGVFDISKIQIKANHNYASSMRNFSAAL